MIATPRSIKLTVLRSRRDFLRVQTKGRRFRGEKLLLLVLCGEAGECRTGLTVSRKVGGAVVRNRVRRRLREILRGHRELLCAGCDHVVVALPLAARTDFASLSEELTWLLSRARAWALSRACSSA